MRIDAEAARVLVEWKEAVRKAAEEEAAANAQFGIDG
jgi:hypothetical protein